MNYQIRQMREEEYGLLADFLYEAIFQREGDDPVPREIIEEPALRVYIDEFGKKKGDYCLCAETRGRVVGAVWVRIIPGYGSIDPDTPEFAISLLKEYRGCGIGTKMMEEMLRDLGKAGYEKVSLAVQKDNYALKMYQHCGFRIVDENTQEYLMACDLHQGCQEVGQGD